MSQFFVRQDLTAFGGNELNEEFFLNFNDDDNDDNDFKNFVDEIKESKVIDNERTTIESREKDVQTFFEDEEDTNLKILKNAWLNEHYSPEILPYEPSFERLNETLEDQTVQAETLALSQESSPTGMLLFCDIERIKYIMNRYRRTRLFKIEKHVFSILDSAEYTAKLSPSEKEFAERYKQLIEEHEHASFLHILPNDLLDALKNIEEGGVGTSFATIEHPNLNQAVFCRLKEDIGSYVFPSSHNIADPEILSKNDSYLVKYMDVRNLLEKNNIELI